MGNLQQRFEELKQKLMAEGLFEQERKKAIPLLPLRVGVITSPDGAAIRDFLQIVNRRFPDLNVKIYPASVQGKGAEKQVADGVRFFNNTKCVDIIVITRGGGSMEDLWPFNEEILARAVADSDLPVVSAVGHEVDFTICDFVADLRVPTPSSAAELVIGKQEEFAEFLRNSQRRMKTTLELVYERYSKRLRLAAESYVFREPKHVLREKQQQLDEASKNMTVAMSRFSEQYKMKYAGISGRLKALSPVNVLKRGYAVITDKESGKILTSPEVSAGTKLRAYVNQGQINLCSEGGKKKDLNEILFDLTHKND
jgi:exodeoxyribonuclease VII large subunit